MMHHRRFIVTPKTCHRVVVPTFFGLSIAILFFFCPAVISCCLCRHTSQIMCNQLHFSSDFCHKNGVIVTWKTSKTSSVCHSKLLQSLNIEGLVLSLEFDESLIGFFQKQFKYLGLSQIFKSD